MTLAGAPRHRASCDPPPRVLPADVLGTWVEVQPEGRSDSETSAFCACVFSEAVAAAPADPDRAPAARPPTAIPMPIRRQTVFTKGFFYQFSGRARRSPRIGVRAGPP